MHTTEHLLFAVIQSVICGDAKLYFVPTDVEWMRVYEIAKIQAISGVCSYGVEKILATPSPENGECGFGAWGMSKQTFMRWMGRGSRIRKKNDKLDADVENVIAKLTADGFKCCLLKGQSLMKYYPEHLKGLRHCGDIDILVDKNDIDVLRYAYKIEGEQMDWSYKHVHLNIVEKSYVDLHYRIAMSRNLIRNHKIQKWCNELKTSLSSYSSENGYVTLKDKDNVVFLLLHALWHFLFEGVGLRQMMDLYFAVSNSKFNVSDLSIIRERIDEFGLKKFASACAWLMWYVFDGGYTKSTFLREGNVLGLPNEKEGRFLLKEIMTTGNFGHFDNRKTIKPEDKGIVMIWKKAKHYSRYAEHYPVEFLWLPVSSLYIRFWRHKISKQPFINVE